MAAALEQRTHDRQCTADTSVYIIASPRPGTGKTFLARLLTSFYISERRPVRAFDVNPQEPTLVNYVPLQTALADVADTRGQMALFDALVVNDGSNKVVDLQHGSFKQFFTVVEQISFFEEARRHAIEPVILFPADPHPASPGTYVSLQKRFPQIIVVPVQNEGVARLPKLREQYPTFRAAGVPVNIHVLLPALKAVVDRHQYSFADLQDTLPTDIPIDISSALRNWTKRAFLELRELELRLILEKLRTSLTGIG